MEAVVKQRTLAHQVAALRVPDDTIGQAGGGVHRQLALQHQQQAR